MMTVNVRDPQYTS